MGISIVIAMAVIFAVALIGLVGLVVLVIRRRMDRWAEAMIASFGMMRMMDECEDSYRRIEFEEMMPQSPHDGQSPSGRSVAQAVGSGMK